MSFSRRDLLKWGLGAAAVATANVRLPKLLAADDKKIPIGVQLYSIRDVAPKDPAAVIADVAKMGYQGVEFAGYYDMKAEDLRKLLDQNGLKCCGTHTALDTLTGDALKGTVEFNQTLGNPYLIVPWLPPTITTSIPSLIDTAKQFTEIAAKVKDQGMFVGYHAHAHDLTPVDGQIPWDVFFTHAGPEVVMQLDTGNCLQGGGDPVAILKKFPGRATTIHLKEFGGPSGAVIGQGDVPWKEVFEVCESNGGTKWYIVEQESFTDSSMDSVALDLKNLRDMGQ